MPRWWDVPPYDAVLPEYGLDVEEWTALCHLMFVLCWLSLVLCMFVFISYAIFKHRSSSRLVIYFSFSVCANSGILLMLSMSLGSVLTSPTACLTQGIFNQYFACATVMWWLCITVNLYATFVKKKKVSRYEPHMHVLCWGSSLALTVAPTAAKQMQVVGLWCWIKDWEWQLGAYYGIMGGCWLIGAILWCFVIASIIQMSRKYQQYADRSAVSVHVVRQSMFVIWFLAIFLFMFIHRLYFNFTQESPFVWMYLHTAAMCSQGIFVFLVFGMRLEIFLLWRNLLCHRCGRKAEYDEIF